MRNSVIALSILAIALFAPNRVFAQQVLRYIDGYQGNVSTYDDTTMKYWSDGNQNGGRHNSFAPGRNEHSLLRFNLSAIPANATCVSAKLYMYHDNAGENAPNPAIGNVYSVSVANRDWISGNKNITNASSGETTWNYKASDGNGGVLRNWASGQPGCSVAGVDFEATPLGSYSANPQSGAGAETVINLTPGRIQRWFGSMTENYGIVIIGTNNSEIHWGQADWRDRPEYRPKLVVEYTLSGSPTPTPTMLPTPLGDANGDNVVNGMDYMVWRSNYNKLLTGPSYGDFNSSGKVDGSDYMVWRVNYRTY